MIDPNLWLENIKNPEIPDTVDDLTDTVKSLFQWTFLNKKTPIKLEFSGRINPVHLACVLRCLSRHKDTWPGWYESLEVARINCIEKGLDVNDVLYGMIK